MATRISHVPFYGRLHISDWALFAIAVLYAIPVAALLCWKLPVGIAAAAVPFVILLIAHGPATIYLLIVATFAFFPAHGWAALLPADVAAFILIAAWILDTLSRGRVRERNSLARPFLLYVAVVLLSVALSGFTEFSVRFFLRQVVLFGTFLSVFHFGRRMNPRAVLILFVLAANLNSLYSVLLFLGAGGGIRSFGLAGRGFGDHAMLGFLIAVVFYLWSRDIRARIFWGLSCLLLLAALAATQTRASMIGAGWGLLVIIVGAWRSGRTLRIRLPRRNFIIAVVLLVMIVPVLMLYTPVFEGVIHRFERIGLHASGTILLRITLWKAALKAFLSHPILGIGAGNFPIVIDWVPDVKFDPIFYLVAGLSTHAIVMTALAETGIMGLLALGFFLFRAVRMAYRKFIAAQDVVDRAVLQCFFVIALMVLGTSLYAGSWFWGNNSYHMAVFFGLAASYRPREPVIMPEGASL